MESRAATSSRESASRGTGALRRAQQRSHSAVGRGQADREDDLRSGEAGQRCRAIAFLQRNRAFSLPISVAYIIMACSRIKKTARGVLQWPKANASALKSLQCTRIGARSRLNLPQESEIDFAERATHALMW